MTIKKFLERRGLRQKFDLGDRSPTLGTRGFSRVVRPKTRAAKKLRGRALLYDSKPETAHEKPLVPRVQEPTL